MIHALTATGNTMERVITRILRIHTGEMALTSLALSFGLWTVAPGNPQSSPGYVALRHVMPVEFWGTVSLIIGVAFILSRVFHNRVVFAFASFSSSLWWTFIAITYGMLNASSTAVPVFGSMALTSMLAYLKNSVPTQVR